ncbi:MAG: STAS/SEC14 domain-containing protein [Nitrospirales bacterium]
MVEATEFSLERKAIKHEPRNKLQLQEENDGRVLAVHVSGKLVKADYEQFVPEFERLVPQHGKLRVLFDMTDFHGWEAGTVWEDFKFGIEHFADIERLAMVRKKPWQHGMATFCKPFTKATVRYFDHADADEPQNCVGQSVTAFPRTTWTSVCWIFARDGAVGFVIASIS